MILGFTGLMGSGKTYSMVERALRWRGKRPIFSNMGLSWATEFTTFDDLVGIHNALVLLDEAAIWFNSRKWNDVSLDVMGWFCQSRKHGCDLMWTSQHVMSVDTHVRRLTLMYCVCNRLLGNIIVHSWWDGASNARLNKSLTWLKPDVMAAYDTLETVGTPDGKVKRGRGAAAEGAAVAWAEEALEGAVTRSECEDGLGPIRWRPASLGDLLRGAEVLRYNGRRWRAVEVPEGVDLEALRCVREFRGEPVDLGDLGFSLS